MFVNWFGGLAPNLPGCGFCDLNCRNFGLVIQADKRCSSAAGGAGVRGFTELLCGDHEPTNNRFDVRRLRDRLVGHAGDSELNQVS